MMQSVHKEQGGGAGRGYTVLLILFFLLAYLLPLGVRDLMVPDETRYAEIPREMIAGGDWVTPHLDGVRYFEKPVLGYWVHAGSQLLFGQNNFAVRLPSGLAVGLTALLLFLLVSRTCRKAPRQNLAAAALVPLAYLSCAEVFGVGNTAVLDSLFSFFLTATIIAFFFATESTAGSGKEKGYLLLAGLACGLAFLTKGFLALAVPVLALAPYLLWQRRYRDLWRMSWLPIVVAVLVALPWGVLIQLREPDFWHFFFWNEHIRRFAAGNAQHKEPFWYFFLAAPGMFLPWTFLLPSAIPGIKDGIKDSGAPGRLLRFSCCWLVLPFLFFSVASGKLLTYILPCFPPFAVLVTFGLLHVLEKKERSRLFYWGCICCALLFSVLLLAFLYVQSFGYRGTFLYGQPWKTALAAAGLLAAVALCLQAARSGKGEKAILAFGMAPLLLLFGIHFVIPDPTLMRKSPGPLLLRHRGDISAETVVIADDDTVGAACWYWRRSNVYVLGNPGELKYGLGYADAAGRQLDGSAAAELIVRNPGKAVLAMRGKRLAQLRQQLPTPLFRDDSGPAGYVFWKY